MFFVFSLTFRTFTLVKLPFRERTGYCSRNKSKGGITEESIEGKGIEVIKEDMNEKGVITVNLF